MIINFYKLVNNDESLVYVGSTKKPLEVRLSEHIISHYIAKFKGKKKIASYYIIDGDYFTIKLIESFECIDNKERLMREQEYINEYSGVNKNKSYSEFNQLSKKSWNLYQKNYYKTTPYRQYKKDYYKTNRTKLKNKYIIRKHFLSLPNYIT